MTLRFELWFVDYFLDDVDWMDIIQVEAKFGGGEKSWGLCWSYG